MTDPRDLNKLFEAALNEKEAPSRFGTPESQKKSAPRAMLKANQPVAEPKKVEAAEAASKEKPGDEPLVSGGSVSKGAESDLIDLANTGDPFAGQAMGSLDSSISAELGEILDEKVRKEKRSKKRARLVMLGVFLGIVGGSSAWVVTNPERFEAMKKVVSEIKSAGDIKGMVEKYQKSLDKVAVRGEQIDAATESMGVDPNSMDHVEDQGFDKEMREMMGEDGGPTTAKRDKVLRDKFQSVKETGGPIEKKEE